MDSETQDRIATELAAFEKIRLARCQYEDDGNDEQFFESVDDALEAAGLTPEPCPMCNRYGQHRHDIP